MAEDFSSISSSVAVSLISVRDLTADGNAEHLEEAISGIDPDARIVIDFSGVGEPSPETVVVLVRAVRRRGTGAAPMVLTGASMYLRAIFEEAGLDRLFEIS